MLSIGEAAAYLGLSRDTLRRWEKKGKITSLRSPTNRRYYTQKQLDEIISKPRTILVRGKPSKEKEPQGRETKKMVLKIILFGIVGFLLAAVIVSILQILLL